MEELCLTTHSVNERDFLEKWLWQRSLSFTVLTPAPGLWKLRVPGIGQTDPMYVQLLYRVAAVPTAWTLSWEKADGPQCS